MKLERILPFARTLLQKAIKPGDIAIDATIGNGHDTVLLAELVGENGHIYGFDVQADAIEMTTQRLTEKGLQERASLFLRGHENVMECLPPSTQVAGAIFNLGYLPGGDKTIVTTPKTTISAIKQILEMLKPEGILVLVIYHGHPEGAVERDELIPFVEQIDQMEAHVLRYQFVNQQNHPPFIIAIEKR
ncbi:class I SAM-dependent methyltransferase [Bacillus suaedaesalsae]|uniref:Methyltransferase domain-containing protein n=1 Tax=Bacillus suaedaesalsae TaxID=2810349 RepID=A0ABS2DD40_9BACI|nr:class I SAM-dependent methyltransferase [Bacillus suaedaesalsae]MBM6616370.1 methyltransferase domain-containing protein [Bacillus suaedaesalsae]